MRIHKRTRDRFYTVLGNEILRDNRLSFLARGLLAYLLSFTGEISGADIKTLAANNPEGQQAIARAFRELVEYGYVKRARVKGADNFIRHVVEVFDTPSLENASAGRSSGNPEVKKTKKNNPNPPTPRVEDAPGVEADAPGEGEGKISADDNHGQPAAPVEDEHQGDDDGPDDDGPKGKPADAAGDVLPLLGRIRQASGDRLAVPAGDAGKVLPLVRQWRDRGASDAVIVAAVTADLPSSIRSVTGFVLARLRDRLPAPVAVEAPAMPAAPLATCDGCERAFRGSDRLCGGCKSAAAKVNPVSDDKGSDPALSGAALARRLMAERRHAA